MQLCTRFWINEITVVRLHTVLTEELVTNIVSFCFYSFWCSVCTSQWYKMYGNYTCVQNKYKTFWFWLCLLRQPAI